MPHRSTVHANAAGSRLIRAILAGLATIVVAAASPAAATDPAPQNPAASGVPTTKILAIGTRTAKGTPEAVRQQLPAEVRETVQLYLAGKLDQWFVKQDQSGVVFILNVTDLAEAKAMLGQLPLGRAELMEFQFIPLGPLRPLGLLLTKPND